MENAKAVQPPPRTHGETIAVNADQPVNGSAHGVSCLMPTRGRLLQPMLAVRMFQAQTYPWKELIVVDDNVGDDLASRLDALGDPRIRVVRPARRGLSLGRLRALAVAEARFPLVCTWDDDDLHDPNRINAQVQALQGLNASVCLLEQLWVWWPREGRLALSKRRGWEQSLICERRQLAYPDIDLAEDLVAVDQMNRRLESARLSIPGLYVYVAHGENAWGGAHFKQIWEEAQVRLEGAKADALLAKLTERLPVEDYRRSLPSLPISATRVNLRLVKPAVAQPTHPSPVTSTAPRFLFLQVNKRCNLRCQHCDFWKLDDEDRANYLSAARKTELIQEFSEMNPKGALVICGGESMLDLQDYFGLASACRSAGLKCLSVVNGTRIRDPLMAERMIREGPHEISVSLNSHRADLHDRTRGVNGSFRKAVRAVRLLVEARRRLHASGVRIYVMGLIFDDNFRELEDFYDFVLNDLGADKLKLNFLQPSFGHGTEADDFFAEHAAVDPDELAGVLDRCEARYRLGYSPVWRRQVHMYFSSLQGAPDLRRGWSSERMTREHICNTYERNIMVDHYGMARLCFSQAFAGAQLRERGDLARFWASAGPVRDQMRRCNRTCGISHSVRREPSTLRPYLQA